MLYSYSFIKDKLKKIYIFKIIRLHAIKLLKKNSECYLWILNL